MSATKKFYWFLCALLSFLWCEYWSICMVVDQHLTIGCPEKHVKTPKVPVFTFKKMAFRAPRSKNGYYPPLSILYLNLMQQPCKPLWGYDTKELVWCSIRNLWHWCEYKARITQLPIMFLSAMHWCLLGSNHRNQSQNCSHSRAAEVVL